MGLPLQENAPVRGRTKNRCKGMLSLSKQAACD